MFFTCKNFMFSDFMWKKSFPPGNGGGLAPHHPPPSPLTPLFLFLLPFILFLTLIEPLPYEIVNPVLLTRINFFCKFFVP